MMWGGKRERETTRVHICDSDTHTHTKEIERNIYTVACFATHFFFATSLNLDLAQDPNPRYWLCNIVFFKTYLNMYELATTIISLIATPFQPTVHKI